MFIYKITNNFNSKVYIGQTSRSVHSRFNDHAQPSTKSLLNTDRRLYGKENFSIEIIGFCLNKKQLDKSEKQMIEKYNSLVPNGYNLCFGGSTNLGYKHKEISKKRMSIAKKGVSFINSGNFIHKNPPKPVKGVHTKTGEIIRFSSVREASKNGFNLGHVASCCRGEIKTHKKYKWEYENDQK